MATQILSHDPNENTLRASLLLTDIGEDQRKHNVEYFIRGYNNITDNSSRSALHYFEFTPSP